MEPNGPIVRYVVHYSAVDSGETQTANTSDTVLDLTGLAPFTNYSVSVQACTVVGCGDLSPPSMQDTQEEGMAGWVLLAEIRT